MTLKTDLDNIVNGDGKETNFASQMMKMYMRADGTNRFKIHSVWPNLADTVDGWKASPTQEIPDLPYD